jgi:holo-[acyl-carrier protein] synthase
MNLDERLERTLPYGTVRRAVAAAMAEDSFAGLFNPVLNPEERAAVRTSRRRHARGTAPSLEPGSPLPEGIDMPRTPPRAPRHAPDVRIGCDVHPVSQTAASIALFGERYLRRVFTPEELAQCGGDVERLTGRFAAKEAVLKVLQPEPSDAVPWWTIEVRSGRSGAPFVSLSGHASELAARQGIERIDISVSHDAGIGIAVAAAVRTYQEAS